MPTLSITVTTQQGQRIGQAFGHILNLKDAGGQPRSATLDEVKAWLIKRMRSVVLDQEHEQARDAALAAISIVDLGDIT